MKKTIDTITIDELELDNRTLNLLKRNGIFNIKQLREYHVNYGLYSIRGFGATSSNEIMMRLSFLCIENKIDIKRLF